MDVIDAINRTMGSGKIRLTSEGIEKRWKVKAERKTPSYTKRLGDVPAAHA